MFFFFSLGEGFMPFVSFDFLLHHFVSFLDISPHLEFSVPFTRSFVIVALLNHVHVYAHNSVAAKLDIAKLDSHL